MYFKNVLSKYTHIRLLLSKNIQKGLFDDCQAGLFCVE